MCYSTAGYEVVCSGRKLKRLAGKLSRPLVLSKVSPIRGIESADEADGEKHSEQS
jgi:hypothetical protein